MADSMRTRAILISVLALCAGACTTKKKSDGGAEKKPATAEAETPSGDGAEGGKKQLPTMSELHPVIQESGAEGVVPSEITIELSQPIGGGSIPKKRRHAEGAAAAKDTLVKLTPEVEGTLSWKSPSTLVFTPTGWFLPDTKYTVSLESLAIGDNVIKADMSGAYERTFTTPKFKHVRTNFFAFNPRKHRLEVELEFSAPVDVDSVKRNGTWNIDGMPLNTVLYERTDRKNVVRVTITDKRVDNGTSVTYLEDPGVLSIDKKIKAPASNGTVKINEGDPITVYGSHVQEGTSGFYVAVICRDEGSSKDKQYYYDEVGGQSYEISARCVLEESDAQDSVHFNPPVKFSVSPTRGGFRLIGDFKRGSYSMRIDANARSMDGGVLKKPYEASFSVPARKPQLSFVSQGRYLPSSAWKNLAIRHMNVSVTELIVRNIPLENLVFWMSAEQETADERNSTIVYKKPIPLKGDADVLTTSWIDVASLVGRPLTGVTELQLNANGANVKSRVMVTDINLIAKQYGGPQGAIDVWVTGMHQANAVSGARVKSIVLSGRTISSCTTDGSGHCKLEGSKGDNPDPSEPFAIIAQKDNDLTYVKFSELKVEIADSMVQGAPFSGGSAYRSSIYSDRGVYRPGETAHLAAIIRGEQDKAPAEGMPVEMKLIDPKKKVARKLIKKTDAAGLIAADFKFDDYADTGSYQVTLEAGKRGLGEYTFNVEEFVPERMKVTLKPDKTEQLITESVPIDVSAQYLFGGSAAGSRVEMSCELKPAQFAPKNNNTYQYGAWHPDGEKPQPIAVGNASGELGDDGHAKLSCPPLLQRGSFSGTGRLVAKAQVFESGSGRVTQNDVSSLVHPESYYIGLSSGTQEVKAGTAFNVEGVTVDWTGKQIKDVDKVEIELFRVQDDNDWTYDQNGNWTFRHYTRLASEGRPQSVAIKDGKFSVSLTSGSNAWSFVVRAKAGKALTDLRLSGNEPYWWWWSSENGRDETPRPQKPASVAITAPESIKVGQKVKVSFESPFKGRALLTVETDEVVTHEWMDVQAGKSDWSFSLKEFAPNVYVSALVVKDPHLDSKESFLPSRAFGVQSVRVLPEEFTHQLKMEVPNEVRSNSKLEVKLDFGKLDEPTVVTVAAVDEGILSLTKFKSPNPIDQIFEPRALGILTYETVGWNLLLPAGGTSRSEGGDEEGAGAPSRVQPVKPVALWSGVVEVPATGKKSITFDVPQYRGSLRVMAVSAGPKKMGHASANVFVRDPLVLQTTLPRFLTYGDNAEVPVFVTNMSGKPQSVEIGISAEPLPVPGMVTHKVMTTGDVIAVKGSAKKKLELKADAHGTVVFRIKSLQAVGAAKLRVHVQAGEIASDEELDVPFVPAAPKTREVKKFELSEGRTDLLQYLKGWVPTTEKTTIWVTSNPYGESFDHLAYLLHYPYGCIEQTTSSTRPLLYAANLIGNVDPTAVAADKIENMVMAGINRIFSMQTPSGGFGYWPGDPQPNPWGTAYATHLLIDAQNLKYPVPEERLKDALDWIESELTNRYENGRRGSEWYYYEDAEPYMHFVLALKGRGRKARIDKLISDISGKSKHDEQDAEKLYMLKAAAHWAGNRSYDADLKNPDVSDLQDVRRNSWSFYSDRRRRGFMLSTFHDLFGLDPAGKPLANLVAEGLRAHPSYWYTTQELVWGVTGLGKWVGETTKDFSPGLLYANGKELKSDSARPGSKSSDRSWAIARASEYDKLEVELTKASGKVYLILASEGVKENAKYRVGGEGLSLKRGYVNQSGEPIDLGSGSLKLGAVVYATVSIANMTGERIQNIALVDRFPAGWEIENPRLGRGDVSMDWIDKNKLWQADYMNLRDDRIELFGSLGAREMRLVVYALRAVTSGQFNMPPVEAEAMYYPDHWAREPGQRVVITGPWDDYGD
jgi:uncharacterized protein YfaS (alpha-2-macroglobulin family)